ncbi:TPA: YceI family protein [Vibrio vulnificus]|nr:YceI family protein [Vibrio vulnificus]
MKKVLLYGLAIFSLNSFANEEYTLLPNVSSVGFVTIKNQFIVEPAVITALSGIINTNGSFEVSINLNSINTGIPIRDARLNEIYFESSKYPFVKVTGNIDLTLLEEGSHSVTIPTQVSLFGKSKVIEFPVVILKVGNIVMVSSSIPIVISAEEFGIPKENLQKLAATVGGIKISDMVPVTINMTFNK